ncbi:SpdA protein [Streptomyces solisilvae]|uniref:SpdA protein n=1 Tax=Streptomyces malaysiensis TaxID=92644 RepID=UPI00332123B3
MAAVVGLTFLFGFGNVWTLAVRLGVPPWVAPLVAPAVDLSVLGLLLGTRYLALQGANREQLRPARRLLIFSSLMTLALNVTDPLLAGQNGKAAFDAVGPLLLIGWAEVGPGLLQAISGLEREKSPESRGAQECSVEHAEAMIAPEGINIDQKQTNFLSSSEAGHRTQHGSDGEDLLERALAEDAWHWETYQRPISAETLRKRLHVGAARSRMLVAVVRSTRTGHLANKATRPQPGPDCADGAEEEGPTLA